MLLRKAFDAARVSRFDLAEQNAQAAVGLTNSKASEGYLKQQLAEYVYHTNPVKAQEIQLSAVQLNRALVRPIAGITYRKLATPMTSQSATAVEFMKIFLEQNELLIWINALLEALAWGEEYTDRFEAAILDLGKFLGFGSQRPEKDNGKGPDNLWALGDLQYLVIECKSGVTSSKPINKHDCNQLNGSMTWFQQVYDHSCSATPVLVHPKITPESAATLHPETRIITVANLADLAIAIKEYAIAIAKAGHADPKTVAAQLQHFGLDKAQLLPRYSTKPKAS